MRIPVVDRNHKPLMPTTSARARKWIESGKAIKRWSDCGQFYVQLTADPSGCVVQDIVVGIDPGKRKYGGSTTRHSVRKGDLVTSPKGIGYVSGDTEKQVSVSDVNWKRLGQISAKKVQLIHRSNGLIVAR